MSDKSLNVKIWDVQHGSASYMRMPNGSTIVQDLGAGSFLTGSETFSPLNYIRDEYGIEKLNWAIITHPHRDHIDDILNLDQFDPRRVSRPKNLDKDAIMAGVSDEDKPKFEKYFENEKRYTATVRRETNLEYAENTGGVDIQLFRPDPHDSSNLNDRSLVTVLSYADNKLILPGDNEEKSWKELLTQEKFRDAISGTGIFVASHHGRDSGFCGEIFKYLQAEVNDYFRQASGKD